MEASVQVAEASREVVEASVEICRSHGRSSHGNFHHFDGSFRVRPNCFHGSCRHPHGTYFNASFHLLPVERSGWVWNLVEARGSQYALRKLTMLQHGYLHRNFHWELPRKLPRRWKLQVSTASMKEAFYDRGSP